MTLKTTIVSAVFVFSFIFARSQDSISSSTKTKRIYVTKSIGQNAPPEIDGLLNDDIWDIVEWQSNFTQWRPDADTPPSYQTKFKIIYDRKNIYMAIRMYDDEPDKIVKRLSRRDGFNGDWIEINFDSYHDLRTGFSFNVTAAGVKGDEFISNNGNNWDGSWNPIWYTRTNIDDEGWTAELKIPFTQLRFGNAKEQIWGLQVNRRFFRNEERSLWQPVAADAPGWVSEMGELHGLIDLEPQKQLEIQPFGVAQLETYPEEPGNPFRDGSDVKLNGGVDAKIGITNDLTLDLTINPDFGQVEADPSSITLDGFEIFFNEQRPFFVENKNIFDYRFSNSMAGNTFGFDNLFFSRRIGRSPQGYPDTQDGEFVNQPQNTTILGAAKFSGKTRNGWSIGLLESMTSKEYAEIDNSGDRREELVEPFTNYLVSRLQKDFNNQNTFIGGIFTATNRNLTDNLDFLHKSAYTGGLDFKHQWKNRAWYVGGNLVFSRVQGSKEAIQATQESQRHLFHRVDAAHVEVDPNRTSLTGTGGNIQIGKAANGSWRFESGFTWRSPELELNDLGFQRQADDLRHYTWVGYRILKPKGIFRTLGINYNHWSAWDFDGNHNLLQWNVNSWANFQNNWFGNIGFNYRPVRHSNFALRGGPRLRISPFVNYWNSVGTDNRKKVRLNLFHNGGKATDNSFNFFNIGGGITYRPMDALRVSVNPSYNINNDKLQFVSNVETDTDTKYINAKIEQRTLSMSLRVNYTVNPNLTIQYWGQPFISRGRYMNFKTIKNAQARNFENRFTPYSNTQLNYNSVDDIYEIDEDVNGTIDYTFGNPDFSFVQFRSNLVVRWEYIPGSELFFVWSQGISGSGNPADSLFESLDDQIVKGQPDNIFLIKATYRFLF